jgi:hypothetical protein
MNRTAEIGKPGDKRGTGSPDRPAGENKWDKTTVAGQPWQERYKRTVKKRKDRTAGTGQPRQDNCGRTTRKEQLGQDRDRSTTTGQTRQDSHDGIARTGDLGQGSQDRSVWRG